jgi:hypothetical protein
MPQLGQSVIGFPQRRSKFEPMPDNVGFVVYKVSLEQVFSEYFGFTLQILIPPTAPHSSSIIRGWYNKPVSG